jgi:hypothetical protein
LTAPAVYLERDASGQRLLGLRLIAEHDEERWDAPRPDADDSQGPTLEPARAAALAAAWLKSRLTGSARLSLLCLDPRGAACHWLETPDTDPAVLRAVTRQAPPGSWGDWGEASPSAGLDQQSSSLQSLGAPATVTAAAALGRRRGLALPGRTPREQPRRRTAVTTVTDLPVRLLLDELDRRGVSVDRVALLWHVMAAAWDPAAEAGPAEDDPLLTREAGETAVVLIEPEGRIQWAWSAQGSLLAAGASRLDPAALEDTHNARASTVGRLASDWLAWAVQLGRSPTRVICLAAEELGPPERLAVLGRALGAAWSEAATDLFRVPDPVGTTIRRLADTSAGGRPRRALPDSARLEELAARPSRKHRAMYRFSAAALILLAVGLILLGLRFGSAAARVRQQAQDLVQTQRERIRAVLPAGADLTFPTLAVRTHLENLNAQRSPGKALTPVWPILAGADQIAFVLASFPDTRLERLTLQQISISLLVSGPNTASVEPVPQTLEDGTDLFVWRAGPITRRGDRDQISITGQWTTSP